MLVLYSSLGIYEDEFMPLMFNCCCSPVYIHYRALFPWSASCVSGLAPYLVILALIDGHRWPWMLSESINLGTVYYHESDVSHFFPFAMLCPAHVL